MLDIQQVERGGQEEEEEEKRRIAKEHKERLPRTRRRRARRRLDGEERRLKFWPARAIALAGLLPRTVTQRAR